jgi:serine phosphatase RsbU (regulator of sigma subunit)
LGLIVERTNSFGEQFGEERLLEHLRTKSHRNIHDFTRELFDKVQTFGDDKELDDDVTLAVVKFSNG